MLPDVLAALARGGFSEEPVLFVDATQPPLLAVLDLNSPTRQKFLNGWNARSPSARGIKSNSTASSSKTGILDLTGHDRAMIYAALLSVADKLHSDWREHARALSLWTANRKRALEDG